MERERSPQPESKQEYYQELLGSPDAIVVLSGGTVERPRTDGTERRSSTAYSDVDGSDAIVGGKGRVVAAAEVAPFFPEAAVVTTSDSNDGPESDARIMASELARHGVRPDRIMLEERSVNTLTELAEMVKLAVRQRWQEVRVLTSDYHIPRVEEMFRQLPSLISAGRDPEFTAAWSEFQSRNISVRCVSAEEILPHRSPHYQTLIARVRQSPEYQRRVELERRGLQQLRDGTYGRQSGR